MKHITKISLATAVAGLVLMTGSARPVRALAMAAPSGFAQDHDHDHDRDDRRWEEGPRDFDDVARRGFREGIDGAHKDFENHRSPDPRHRDEYRHPHVPRYEREAYRRGFERGYREGWEHIQHRPY